MNLWDKKAEFGRRPIMTAEDHALTWLHDQNDVRARHNQASRKLQELRQLQSDRIEASDHDAAMGLHFAFGLALHHELSETYTEMLDTPFHCSADYYAMVVNALGFETVATYNHTTERHNGDKTFICARPDGLILVWDTYETDKRNGAELNFQWLGYDQKHGHPQCGVSGGFEKTEDGRFVYCGSIDAREGLRQTIDHMQGRGQFLSPFAANHEFSSKVSLVSSIDHYDIRDSLPKSERTSGHEAKADTLNKERYLALPLWVKQMINPWDNPINPPLPKSPEPI